MGKTSGTQFGEIRLMILFPAARAADRTLATLSAIFSKQSGSIGIKKGSAGFPIVSAMADNAMNAPFLQLMRV